MEPAVIPGHPESVVRCEVIFRGRVQGVGFRATTCAVARHYTINGYVVNLGDGDVRMIAEGTRGTVSRMIQEVLREMGENIREYTETWGPSANETGGFVTRHEA